MNWIYVSAVVAAAVASMHYVRTVGEQESQPRTRLGRAILDAIGLLGVGLLLALMVGGLLAGPWWWPLIAFLVGLIANTMIEESQLVRLARLWVLPLVGASAALTALLWYLKTAAF